MQAIARQLNLVETVFIIKPDNNDKVDFELRYFTPIKEVPIAGHPTVATFIALKTIGTLMKVKRNINQLRDLCNELNIGEVQAFTFETYNRELNIHTRNICPRNGIEDPGCGIGNAALGAYLLKNKYFNQNEIKLKAEQGNIVNMPCIIEIYASKKEDKDMQVLVGGSGRVMIKGEFNI